MNTQLNVTDKEIHIEQDNFTKYKKDENNPKRVKLSQQQNLNSEQKYNEYENIENKLDNNTNIHKNLIFKKEKHITNSISQNELQFEEQKGVDVNLLKNNAPNYSYHNLISKYQNELHNKEFQENYKNYDEDDNDDKIEEVDIEIISYEDSSQSQIIDEQIKYDEIEEEEENFELYMKSNCQQFGLCVDTSSENDTKSEEQDIFLDYSEIGKGYLKFNIPKLQKEILEMDNNKKQIETLNQQLQNQQSYDYNTAFNKTRNKSLQQQTTDLTKKQQEILIKDRLSRISYFHQHLQQKKQIDTILGENKAALISSKVNYANTNNQIGKDYKQQYISSRKKRVYDPELESFGLQSLNKRRATKTSGQQEESEIIQQQEEQYETSKEHVGNTIQKKNKQNKPKNTVRNNRNNDNSNLKSESSKVQSSTITAASSKKKVETNLDEEEDCSNFPITLPKEQQMELLKYHKRSKNYHGTAKQFGISHEEARVIVKKLKKEYKSIQNY